MAWRLVNSQPQVGPALTISAFVASEAAIVHSDLAGRNGAGSGRAASEERRRESGHVNCVSTYHVRFMVRCATLLKKNRALPP